MAPIRKTKKTKWEQSATEKALISFFDLYNCKFTTHDFDGGKFRNYSFVFQGGHFVARGLRDTEGVDGDGAHVVLCRDRRCLDV